MLAGACFTGVSVFTGAAMVGNVWDGFPVRIMLSKIKTTIHTIKQTHKLNCFLSERERERNKKRFYF